MTATTAPPLESGRRFALDATAGRLTPAERAERGRAARAAVPRDSHAVYDPPADRPDPVGLLERQAVSRVPDLVPVRYGRMLASPFSYFRGAALPMAADLAATPSVSSPPAPPVSAVTRRSHKPSRRTSPMEHWAGHNRPDGA